MARFLLLLCALVASANALLLPVRTPSGPALVQRTRPTFMQAEPPTEGVVGDPEGATEMAPDEKDGYQTYYDDEKVLPMPPLIRVYFSTRYFFAPLTHASSLALQAPVPQTELSQTMKDRLIAESRGLGADPNSKNPFLPVFFGVGVFVTLGALAVNM